MANPIIRRLFGIHNHRNDLSADEARALLAYDPETGELKWKSDTPWASQRSIATVPRRDKSPRVLVRFSVTYQAHRLIWLIMTGEWPEDEIDHVNGDGADNRWVNLRAATRSQNAVNRHFKNGTGYRGVRQLPNGTYRARIKILETGKRIELGTFATAEEAYEAYKRAALEHHGPFARLI